MTNAQLLAALESLKSTMVSVATGGAPIDSVKNDFVLKHDEVESELIARGIELPLPYRDLWQWYGRWSNGDLLTYRSRRLHVAELFDPLLKAVRIGRASELEPTGWERVDRTIKKARTSLAEGATEEQFQGVGLLCREALISTAQVVFDEAVHPTVDGVKASKTDAKRMLEAYVTATWSGAENEYLRKHARSALDLAVALQHKRTATFRDAALCLEATASVVNQIAILKGLRDPVRRDDRPAATAAEPDEIPH